MRAAIGGEEAEDRRLTSEDLPSSAGNSSRGGWRVSGDSLQASHVAF